MGHRNNDLVPFSHNVFWPEELISGFFNDNFWDGFGLARPGFRVDIKDNKDSYIIEADMPGIDKENVNIEVDANNMLTISVNTDESLEEKDDRGQYIRRERRRGYMSRSFSAENIDTAKIKAVMKNGVLQLTCPKKTPTQSLARRIDIG
ncbi:MAG TPA: Hsp20/alpha crystallin family protein [Clostridia bacterium]|nr:Hsp20/alpha crystallin family protein [Clostridia bacterium]